MKSSLFFFTIALPVIALACEGECITGCSTALSGNATRDIVDPFIRTCNFQIASYLGRSGRKHPNYCWPIAKHFEKDGYESILDYVFPKYFHGKCQDKNHGVEPEGCPNPDCPVVCGTPGSMVHFYPDLLNQVEKAVNKTLMSYCTPSSKIRKEIQKRVDQDVEETSSNNRARFLRFSRSSFYPSADQTLSTGGFLKHRRAMDANAAVDTFMTRDCPAMLESMPSPCITTIEKDGKKKQTCAWEVAMKQYFLSFP